MYMYTLFIIYDAQLNLVGARFFWYIAFYNETYVFFAFMGILTSIIESLNRDGNLEFQQNSHKIAEQKLYK